MIREKIIDFLKENEGYLSGEEISHSLNISRAGIWKYIEDLRSGGYEIAAVPHLGYKLVSTPDKLFPNEIQHKLGTKIFGRKIIHYEALASTMDEAFHLGLEGALEGTVVCAEGQSRGRGRLGRHWFSPKGQGIYLSFILRPKLTPSEVARLTLLCAVAVCEAIKNLTNLSAAIKWPNDLLIGGKKMGGILTELNAETDRVKFVVVGIGINVNTKADALPETATSLRRELKRQISRVELTKEMLRQIEKYYLELQSRGFVLIAKKWKELSATLNKRIKLIDSAGTLEGEAVDIDQDGGLLIRKDSGVVVKKMAGDILQLR